MEERMIRKQTYIYLHQDRALKQLASRMQSTEAEIIREALGRYLSSYEGENKDSPIHPGNLKYN